MPVVYEDEYTTLEFPDDWVFGGADGSDPRADPRWMPTTWRYSDASLKVVHITQTPLSDDQAIDQFTFVAGFSNPVYIEVRRPGESNWSMLPVRYEKSNDTAYDIKGNQNG